MILSKLYSFHFFILFLISGGTTLCRASTREEILAYWRFEKIQRLNKDTAPSAIGQALSADDRRPTDPQPFTFDDSGKGNVLQVRGLRPSLR